MKTTRLQGIGIVDAKPAVELKPGDVTVWNFGYMHEVLAVEELSPKFVRLVTKSVTPGFCGAAMPPYRDPAPCPFLVGVVKK
jgi:quercetin dioxygenase-like cupin family protein